MSDNNDSGLFLRLVTPKGVLYEKFIEFVQVVKKDGVMIVNKNYAPITEQLSDGNVEIHEKSGVVSFFVSNSWLTVSDNKCNIFCQEAVKN